MKDDRMKLLGKGPVVPDVCSGPGEPGLVSVLIPTYNRAYILGSTIESVLAQTYNNIEIVVVDDGSTDATRALVERYPKTRYIYQENAGLAAARNTGLQAARGEFIAFQDSDDIWMPWKLEVQVALMRRFPELALAWTDMVAVNPSGDRVHEKFIRETYDAYKRVDVEKYLTYSGFVRDILPGSRLKTGVLLLRPRRTLPRDVRQPYRAANRDDAHPAPENAAAR